MRTVNLSRMLLLLWCGSAAGCGHFMAHRLIQAPNTYPQSLGPKAVVELAFPATFLTNYPSRFVAVGPPEARLRYRVIEPDDFQTRLSATNWIEHGKQRFRYDLRFNPPTNPTQPKTPAVGVVVLLHGYALDHLSMIPWALRLAQEGWRCVLVDLRGHGRSTGKRIFLGLQEPQDLSQLLDALARNGQLREPLIAFGESYGAVIALRWHLQEPRIASVVAMAPYPELAPAVLNIRREYAKWVPKGCLNAGLRKLPSVLRANPAELDPLAWIQTKNVHALFVAGGQDRIVPPTEVWRLWALSSPQSQRLLVPNAPHEALPFFFNELERPLLSWLTEARTITHPHPHPPP